jgi:hypothetical protein
MFNLNQADANYGGHKLGLTGLGEVTLNGLAVATIRADISRADADAFERLLEAVTELDPHTVDEMVEEAEEKAWDEGQKEGFDKALTEATSDIEALVNQGFESVTTPGVDFTDEQKEAIDGLLMSIVHDMRNLSL